MILARQERFSKKTMVLNYRTQQSVTGKTSEVSKTSEVGISHQLYRRAAVAVVVVAVLALLGFGAASRMFHGSEPSAQAAEQQSAVRRVTVVQPERAGASEISLPATVLAYQWTDLHGRVSGYIKHWSADIGAPVKEGEVLAEIDTPELDQELEQAVALLAQGRSEVEQARAELEEGRSEVVLAEANVVKASANLEFSAGQTERIRRLNASGASSREEADNTEREREARQAELDAARADLKRRKTNLGTRAAIIKSREAVVKTRQANVRRLRELQGFKKIIAPFDGVVTRRFAEVGMLVNGGGVTGTQPLFSVAQESVLRVQANVPQAYVGSVRHGETVAVTIPESPGQTHFAKVARTASAIEPSSRTIRVELELPNPDNSLLPGAYAQLKLKTRHSHSRLVVPSSVVLLRSDGPQVAAVEGETVRLVKISLGRDLGRQVEITDGLSGSESLIVNPADDLRSGQTVQVNATPNNSSHGVAARK